MIIVQQQWHRGHTNGWTTVVTRDREGYSYGAHTVGRAEPVIRVASLTTAQLLADASIPDHECSAACGEWTARTEPL